PHRSRRDETVRPARQNAVRVGIVLLKQPAQIDAVTARINEGIEFSFRRDGELQALESVPFDSERTRDAEHAGTGVEINEGDRVAEYVVHPAKIAGRRQSEFRSHQSQAMRVARAQHQPMLSKGHWSRVTIGRRVAYGQDSH